MADSIHSNASATNNNSKNGDGNDQTSENNASIGFSSLMDIGQAYGIWNPDVDGANFKSSGKKKSQSSSAEDEKEKLVIDDEQDIDDEDDDDEPLSPGICHFALSPPVDFPNFIKNLNLTLQVGQRKRK